MAKEVFISYKAEEYDEAAWVKNALEENGISCWLAPGSIPGGSSYAVEIPRAIRECKVLVLVLSGRTQESKWVPRELDQAINAGKVILPFMIENCPLKDDFDFYLSNVQRYPAYEDKNAAISKMISEIRSLLGKQTADSQAASAGDRQFSPSAPASASASTVSAGNTSTGGYQPLDRTLNGASVFVGGVAHDLKDVFGKGAATEKSTVPSHNSPVTVNMQTGASAQSGFDIYAVASLLLGILSLLSIGMLFIPQIIGIALAFKAKSRIKATGKSGGKLATAGLICSLISIVVVLAGIAGGVAGGVARIIGAAICVAIAVIVWNKYKKM